jgi:hypothetical protein
MELFDLVFQASVKKLVEIGWGKLDQIVDPLSAFEIQPLGLKVDKPLKRGDISEEQSMLSILPPIREYDEAAFYQQIYASLKEWPERSQCSLFINCTSEGMLSIKPAYLANFAELAQRRLARFGYIFSVRNEQRSYLPNYVKNYNFAPSIRVIKDPTTLPLAWRATNLLVMDNPHRAFTWVRDDLGRFQHGIAIIGQDNTNPLHNRMLSLLQQSEEWSKTLQKVVEKPGAPSGTRT